MKSEIHVLTRGVLIDNEHILLCRTVGLETNFYFLPGGHIERNESAVEALSRELLEETGKAIVVTRFLGCLEYRFKPKRPLCHHHEYNIIFEIQCSELQSAIQPTQCEAHVELHFIPLSKLNAIPLHPPSLANQLPLWLKANASTSFYSENSLF